MDIKNTEIRNNITRLRDLREVTVTYIAKKSRSLVTQSSLSKFMSHPEESNPTVKTLRGIAAATRIEPWMLLIKDFPFEGANGEPLSKISKEGYLFLCAFEKATPETRRSLMKQMADMVSEFDNDKKNSKQLKDDCSDYSSTPVNDHFKL